MRDYSVVTPSFWIGKTGRELRGNPEALVVAFYLISNPYANMIGIYYLPKMMIQHDTGISLQGVNKGLARCIEAGFCRYDDDAEVVWVVNMARFQIGEETTERDLRTKGVHNEYAKVPESPLLSDFYDLYSKAYLMPLKRGLQGACKEHRSQEQDQDQEQDHCQDQEVVAVRKRTASPKPKSTVELSPDEEEFNRKLFDHLNSLHKGLTTKYDDQVAAFCKLKERGFGLGEIRRAMTFAVTDTPARRIELGQTARPGHREPFNYFGTIRSLAKLLDKPAWSDQLYIGLILDEANSELPPPPKRQLYQSEIDALPTRLDLVRAGKLPPLPGDKV